MRRFLLAVVLAIGLGRIRTESAEDNNILEESLVGGECILPPKLPGSSDLAGGLCMNGRFDAVETANGGHVRGYKLVDIEKIPKYFFWGDIHGTNYLTVAKNQHIPEYCGSCWAFGPLAALSDRIKIQRRNQGPDINLAPQVLINCHGGGTCQGGTAGGVYRYLYRYGVPDETCQNYQATNGRCRPHGICEKCSSGTSCKAVKEHRNFKISRSGFATWGDATDGAGNPLKYSEMIMAEIYARGPVACTIFATSRFDNHTGEDIYKQLGLYFMANHVLSLVGWGEENGERYWIGRNSWGTYWGSNGFFKINRGNRFLNLGVENACSFSVPAIPEELLPEDKLPEDVAWGDYLLKHHAPTESPTDDTTIPSAYDIRNIDGRSYASIDRNQNSPRGCESSWAHAATSALNDRFALTRNKQFPQVVVAPQVLLNCIEGDICSGGNPSVAYAYIKEKSIPDESCAPYEGKKHQCDAIHICKNCWPKPGCYAMYPGQYTAYTISDHGTVSGDADVKKEIAKNGPVACRICSSKGFKSYDGGIYSGSCEEGADSTSYVVLSGWGRNDDGEYWIGRNSWGTYWGEDGWFRVAVGEKDLDITKECHWAVPKKPEYRYKIEEKLIRSQPIGLRDVFKYRTVVV